MGASILVHWPGASPQQEKGHPGFYNDDHGWATWLVHVLQSESGAALLERLGLTALNAHTTDDTEPIWTTPDELKQAAEKLAAMVRARDPQIASLVELYEAQEDAAQELVRDLEDITAIADYARSNGAMQMTLGYYW